MKVCTRCGIRKRNADFHKNRPDCKVCRSQNNLEKKYNLRLDQRISLEHFQHSRCGICRKPIEIVDHCHRANLVRGLLCRSCNRGLGLLGDTIESLENAVRYLKNPPWLRYLKLHDPDGYEYVEKYVLPGTEYENAMPQREDPV